MGKEILTFGDIELKSDKFFRHNSPVLLREVDTEKVLVSNKIPFGEKNYKYFIDCLYNYHKFKSLKIMLPKASAYVKSYDGQNKWIYFLIGDDEFLEKHNTIRDNVSADTKMEFDSEPVYNKNYLKTKIKYHGDEVTDF